MSIALPTIRGLNARVGYREVILSDNPVAYWRLGEASGTTAADEKGSYSGTYVNGFTSVAGAVAGNAAAKLNGSSQYINCGNGTGLSFGIGAFSVESWINAVALGDGSSWLHKNNGSALAQWWIRPEVSGGNWRVRFLVASAGAGIETIAATSYGVISTGSWYHIAGTYDGGSSGNIKIYVNGSVSATTAYAVSRNPNNSANVEVGRFDSSTYFNGEVDEVAIYNTALSATRILAHYNAR